MGLWSSCGLCMLLLCDSGRHPTIFLNLINRTGGDLKCEVWSRGQRAPHMAGLPEYRSVSQDSKKKKKYHGIQLVVLYRRVFIFVFFSLPPGRGRGRGVRNGLVVLSMGPVSGRGGKTGTHSTRLRWWFPDVSLIRDEGVTGIAIAEPTSLSGGMRQFLRKGPGRGARCRSLLYL